MITVTQARENDRTTFCRQFTFNKNGYSNRETAGAIVSGMPTDGISISQFPDAEDGSEGTLLKFKENDQGLLFRLLKHNYEGSTRSLIVRVDLHSLMAWNATGVNTYATCSADAWLNGDYMNTLEESVRSGIKPVRIPYTVGGGDQSVSSIERGVFLLSYTEIGLTGSSVANTEGTTLGFFNSAQRRVGYLNGAATGWWTRTPVRTNAYNAIRVTSAGGQSGQGIPQAVDAIRPAFTLPADFLLNPIPNSDGSYSPI